MRALWLSLLVSTTPLAAESTPDPLAALRFFEGDWSGEIAFGGKAPVKVRYVVSPALGGRWLKGVGDFAALGMSVEDFWGIDPKSGKLLRSIFDSNGVHGEAHSAGWKGGVMLWEATVYAGGKAVEVRETITRTEEGFTAVWEQKQPDGTWAAYSRERFTRAAQNKK